MKRMKAALASFFTACIVITTVNTSVGAAVATDTGIATGTSLMWMDDQSLEERILDIKDMGAEWVRIEFNWAEIQPNNRDEYNWGAQDRVVNALDKHGLNALVVLAYTPAWAQNSRCSNLVASDIGRTRCSPANTEDFARFARASVIRYWDRVHTWELWNEPNITGYWKTAANDRIQADPQAYARTASAAAREIKNHDPNAFIITGGLAPMFEPLPGRGMRQSDYLNQLLPELDPALFNAVGVHPYSWPKQPTLPADYNAFYTVDNGDAELNIRHIMQQHGWSDKQLWATEFGASTRGSILSGLHNILGRFRPDHVSEEVQAEILREGMQAWSTKHYAGPMLVHADSDKWLIDHKNEGGFGLRRDDGSKKPAYEVFRKESRNMRQ